VMHYAIRDLGPDCWPKGITATGQVVGIRRRDTDEETRRISVIADGMVRDIGHLPGVLSSIGAVNASGGLTGWLDVGGGRRRAFRHANGRLTELGTLHGGDSDGKAINDRGHVVGWTAAPARPASPAWDYPGPRAVLFDGVALRDLGTLGGPYAFARGINNADQIVGVAMIADGAWHAFLHDAAGLHDLAALAGEPRFAAWAINDAGAVAGTVRERAVLWHGGALLDLGTRAGTRGIPLGINARGAIIGVQYRLGAPGRHDLPGFLWHDGVMRDLDTLLPTAAGWGRLRASAINGLGQLVGRGEYHGEQRGFLLTPP